MLPAFETHKKVELQRGWQLAQKLVSGGANELGVGHACGHVGMDDEDDWGACVPDAWPPFMMCYQLENP